MAVQVSLDKAVRDALNAYSVEVVEVIREVVPEVLKEAQKQLKKTSPKKTGEYAKGWKAETLTKNNLGLTGVVYNAKKPGLTMLLELGHAKSNGGRTREFPHIFPVYDWAVEEVGKRIEEALK